MAIPFQAVVQPDSIVFTTNEGRTYAVAESHPNFQRIREQIKAIRTARSAEEDISPLVLELVRLTDIPAALVKASSGKVTVRDGAVYYLDEEVHGTIANHILWGMREGEDVDPQIAFLENLMENPSKRSVDQLYTFATKHGMAITEDGHLLGYKRVRANLTDCHTGTFDNSPGQIVEMPRNKVNDNPNETCSAGLHFCAQSYLPNFGASNGNRIVIVKVNPRDVVSIPTDYDHAKVRCCRYEVLGEYTGTDKDDLLSGKPVWRNEAIRSGNAWRMDEDDGYEREYERDAVLGMDGIYGDGMDDDTEVDFEDRRDDIPATGSANLSLLNVSRTGHVGELSVTFEAINEWGECDDDVEMAVPDHVLNGMSIQVGVVAEVCDDERGEVVLIEMPRDCDIERAWVPKMTLQNYIGPDEESGHDDDMKGGDIFDGDVPIATAEPATYEAPAGDTEAPETPVVPPSPDPVPDPAPAPEQPAASTGLRRMAFDPRTGAIRPLG